jgi:hypothetical protein
VAVTDLGNDAYTFSGYQASVVDGGNKLINGGNGQPGLTQDVAGCTHVKLMLIGLSQGAHVIA